jgi:hypothetical protein
MDSGFCHCVMAHRVHLAWGITLRSGFVPWLLQRVSSVIVEAPLIKGHARGACNTLCLSLIGLPSHDVVAWHRHFAHRTGLLLG